MNKLINKKMRKLNSIFNVQKRGCEFWQQKRKRQNLCVRNVDTVR